MREPDWNRWITRLQRLLGNRLEPALQRFMYTLSSNPRVRESLAAAGIREAWLREAVVLVPNAVLLVGGLLADRDIPARTKVLFLASVGYVVLPFDVIPDRIPGLGQLDDLLILTVGLHMLLNESNQIVITRHWRGNIESLRLLQMILRGLALRVPQPILSGIRSWARLDDWS